jgi:hypothetical protein
MRLFNRIFLSLSLLILMILSSSFLSVQATEECIACHEIYTPEIVDQYLKSKHNSQVGCFDCHQTTEENPSAFKHSLGLITQSVSPKTCEKCHSKEVEEYSQSKHAWTAFIGPLKPWYNGMLNQGLNPFDMQTALDNNPEEYVKSLVTPLFPDSGALANTGLLNDPEYHHENQVAGCMGCHGTYVVAEEGEILDGWPNTGIGRVNPDGSLGSCSSCHTRHRHSVEEARKPETCGQCHLGPDHPQVEIYEESKHGNIYFSSGESWDWDDEDWGVDDIDAPTCATCHMSGFEGIVETTHETGSRLYWELQPKVSVPQWDSAELTAQGKQSPDIEKAEAGRSKMTKLCGVCHADSWVDGYFEIIDNTISDYNKAHEYALSLLNTAYEEELIDPSNPIDETPEIIYYRIWHDDGRRWRMGASMMGPDWTHWNGAVTALIEKLNPMEEWINEARVTKLQESKFIEVKSQLEDAEVKLAEAKARLASTESQLEVINSDSQSQSNQLLLPSVIIGISIILAALLIIRQNRA